MYLQYKGPGFSYKNVVFRSEFSSKRIKDLVKEESKSKIIHFSNSELKVLISKYVDDEMRNVIEKHLGKDIIKNITIAPVICFYKKEKFLVDYGKFYLEPSLDRLNVFHINNYSFHSLSNFWEYENEIKSENNSFEEKISNLKFLIKFDEKITKSIKMYPESTEIKELKNSGVKIIPPLKNYKVHSKVTQLVKFIDGKEYFYTHLGTGNYNSVTAKQYTDMALLTSNYSIGKEVNFYFKALAKKEFLI